MIKRSLLVAILISCQIWSPVWAAQDSLSLAIAEQELVQAAAELALQSEEPQIGSPLVDDVRDRGLYRDFSSILLTPTYWQAVETGRDHGQIWKNVLINPAPEKFRKLVRRQALDQAFQISHSSTLFVG